LGAVEKKDVKPGYVYAANLRTWYLQLNLTHKIPRIGGDSQGVMMSGPSRTSRSQGPGSSDTTEGDQWEVVMRKKKGKDRRLARS